MKTLCLRYVNYTFKYYFPYIVLVHFNLFLITQLYKYGCEVLKEMIKYFNFHDGKTAPPPPPQGQPKSKELWELLKTET
jgi:hypothetical protein